MTEDFRLYKLEEICLLINRGITPKYVKDGGILILNQKCIRNGCINFSLAQRTDIEKKIPENKIVMLFDILVNSTGVGTLGRVSQITNLQESCTVDSHITIVRANSKLVYPYYLGFILRNNQGLIEDLAEGSTGQTELSRKRLGELTIKLPPLAEQKAIAHILGTLDDKIELNRKMNETLEAIAQAIFKSLFVDFEPVRAKMEGRWQPGQSLPGLPANLYDLFPDKLVDSELGEIPEGWEVGKLNQLSSISTKSIMANKYPAKIYEHYSIPAFDINKLPVLELGNNIKSQKYLIEKNSILVSKLNPENSRVWLPNIRSDNAICSTEFMQFIPIKDEYRPFLYLLMTSNFIQEEILKYVSGSTGSRQRAQPSKVAEIIILNPPKQLINTFHKEVNSLLLQILLQREQSLLLTEIRDTLLLKLISGEIRIKDTGKFLEERL